MTTDQALLFAILGLTLPGSSGDDCVTTWSPCSPPA